MREKHDTAQFKSILNQEGDRNEWKIYAEIAVNHTKKGNNYGMY